MVEVEKLVAEFIKYHQLNDFNSSLRTAGKIIEHICKEIYVDKTGKKTASMNFKDYLSYIRKNELIPAIILTHIYAIQNFRNAETHILDNISNEDYESVLPHIKILFNWYYNENYSSDIFSTEFEIKKIISDKVLDKSIFIVLRKHFTDEIIFTNQIQKLKTIIKSKTDFNVLIVDDENILKNFNEMNYNFISIDRNKVTDLFMTHMVVKYDDKPYIFRTHEYINLVLLGDSPIDTKNLVDFFIEDLDGLYWYLNHIHTSLA
ncbi:MAG: DUF4145 domain-containing protein [Melioribacteraceae bacterium]